MNQIKRYVITPRDSGTGDSSDLFKLVVVDHMNSEEVQKLEDSHQLFKFTSK